MNSSFDHIAFHLMRKLVQEHTACWQTQMSQLTKPQYAVLHAIAEHPGIEQVELTSTSVTTKATLAEMLGRMEKRGLIYRKPSDTDKRRRFVYLTEEGQTLLASSIPTANQVDAVFLQRLTAEEQDEFVRMLNAMTSNQ